MGKVDFEIPRKITNHTRMITKQKQAHEILSL